jgi:hypothetical protein
LLCSSSSSLRTMSDEYWKLINKISSALRVITAYLPQNYHITSDNVDKELPATLLANSLHPPHFICWPFSLGSILLYRPVRITFYLIIGFSAGLLFFNPQQATEQFKQILFKF